MNEFSEREVDSQDRRATRRRWRWATVGAVSLLFVGGGSFYFWATTTPSPGPSAVVALEGDEQVRVIEDDGYTFEPTNGTDVGLIFYPGGRVDPASYAAPARGIAEAGYLVVVPELRLNLAVLDAAAADDVIAAHPGIERWVIGGHSLGGTMAASYAGDHRETISGLVLWASFPSSGTDLSGLDATVASIFGTRDGLTSLDEIEDSRTRLPPDAEFVAIEGGNHAQFGDYGPQSGDNTATISREEQQDMAVQATLMVLQSAERP